MIKICNQCNEEFNTRDCRSKFCSRSCAASFNNKGVRRVELSTKRLCACGNKKDTKSPRCNECKLQSIKNDYLNKTIKEAIVYNDTTIKFNSIRLHARKTMVWNNIPKTCKLCTHNEFDAVAEVCHIKALSSFPDTALIKEVNSLDNLVYLCPSHHALFDKGLITI
jgi:hypothetical protein